MNSVDKVIALMAEIHPMLEKVKAKSWGWKTTAAKARKLGLELEKQFKIMRKETVAAEKE